jgi:hypothetical protein
MTQPNWSQLRRPVAVIILIMLALCAAVMTWQYTSLRGLPDIGDPFDVAAFSAIQVRDEDNAYVLYRQAAAKLRDKDRVFSRDWATASEADKQWLEENREALELWKLGTERPDASFIKPADLTLDTDLEIPLKVRALTWLSCLEASRLESIDDVRGAWVWHRAALRTSRHLGRHSTLIERLIGVSIHAQAANRITAWAKRPQVDAGMLRQALSNIELSDEMASPQSEWVKTEYLTFIHSMERPDLLKALIDGLETPKGSERRQRVALHHVEAFLKREPERSRRLLRLVFANWLAYCDRPKSERPPRLGIHQVVFIPDSTAPKDAQPLTPESLNSWFESTLILRGLAPAFNASFVALDRERAHQATLVIDVASELYRREHGQPPGKTEDLVGPYLKVLPRPD